MIGRNKVRTIHDAATLQYANGKSVARRTIGSGRFSPYIGFHIEAGRDAALDEALRDAGISQCEIKHQRPGGAEVIKHWDFGESIEIYPITSGPVATTVAGSLAGGNARETASSGIGLRWANGERSKLAVRGFLRPLVKVGSLRLVQFSVRSRMTDELLKALLDHGRVCELADHLIDRTSHAEAVTFHEIALPLGPGEETEWGKGDTATVIPVVSYHPPAVDQPYILERWRPDTVHEAALREWEGIQLWAREYALQSDERNPQGDEATSAIVAG